MSDRAGGSVRIDSREDAGTAEGGAAGRPAAGGATAVDPAALAPARDDTVSVSEGRPPAAPAADGTQAITPESVPSGVFAGHPAGASAPQAGAVRGAQPVDAGPVRSPAPAVSPLAPLVPSAGRAPGSSVGAGQGAPGRGAGGTAAPVVAQAGPDATQAVPLPPVSGRAPGPGRAPTASPPPAGADDGQRAAGRGRGARGPRRARLQLRHVDTWSALKISLVVSIALFFVWMIAVGILYLVLNGLGVFSSLNDLIGQVGSSSDTGTGGEDVITARVIFLGAALIGAVNVVLLTALCTVGTVVYNLCSDLVGGVEVTLAERE